MATQARLTGLNNRAEEGLDVFAMSRNGSSHGPDAVMALTIEVIAKPQAARLAHKVISQEVTNALREVTGFAGCMVLASDREWRLLTVITFWTGDHRERYCNKAAPWVRKLLVPHVDHHLRSGTMNAYLPSPNVGLDEETDSPCAPPMEEPSLCAA